MTTEFAQPRCAETGHGDSKRRSRSLTAVLNAVQSQRPPNSPDNRSITVAWNDLTFEDVESIFDDWIRRLAWVIEYKGKYILE
jgi:hypothetical protein